MERAPILGTGLSGLVGSKLAQMYQDKYTFENLDISNPVTPVDITNYDQLLNAFSQSPSQFVIHFAAFTDVTKAWEQKDDKTGIAYRVNVLGTENIVKAASATGKHLIHISTAYVFDGKNSNLYTETDEMNPIEWYGQTKAWAEEKVMASETAWTIFRIDQPFRSDLFPRQDIAHRIIEGLKTGTLYPQFTDHYFGPTFIDDFAKIIEWVLRTNTTGLFHASSGEKWSDYDFANLINESLQLHGEVKKGNLADYLKTLNRPYQQNTAMDSEKLKKLLDFSLNSMQSAINMIEQ